MDRSRHDKILTSSHRDSTNESYKGKSTKEINMEIQRTEKNGLAKNK